MLTKLLINLVRFETLSGNKAENLKALNWIKKQLKGLPVYIKCVEYKNSPSLLITTRKTKNPDFWLQAHLDIVPGPKKLFDAKVKGDNLTGRGVYDMKYGVACYIQLLEEIGNDLPKYNFGVMITTDEETGGFNGVSKLLKAGYTSKFCFLPDGGEDWKFQESAKGILQLKVESAGASAHGSRPWLGKNAIDNLMAFLNKIKELFPSEPCGDMSHNHNTLNIGKIAGGLVTNQVPEKAEASLDIRFIPETNKNSILKMIKSVEKDFAGIKTTEVISGSASKTDRNDQNIKRFSKILFDKFGIKTGFTKSHGSSDARHFSEYKIPVILIRPVGGGIHGDTEWLDIKSLNIFYVALKTFVLTS